MNCPYGLSLKTKQRNRAFEEVRQFFRIRTTMKQLPSLQQQREMFLQRLGALQALVQVI